MSKTIRRFIIIFFIICFLITSPLVLLYAMGYRYNFKKWKLEAVGALFLNGQPKDVEIYINNIKHNQTLPYRLMNLLPNSYNIEIKKDGYFSWTKNLDVQGKQTTFVNNIILFKKEKPQKIFNKQINIIKISPNKTKLLYSTINNSFEEIWIHNLIKKQKELLLYRLAIEDNLLNNKEVWWSNNGDKILIKNNNKFFIFNLKNPNAVITLKDITDLNLNNLQFDQRNSDILYGVYKKSIYQISLQPIFIKKIIELPIKPNYNYNYLVKNGYIYFLEQNKNFTKFHRINIETKNKDYLLNLPSLAKNYYIKNLNESFIALIDQTNQQIYLINISKKIPQYEILRAKNIKMNEDNKKILYFTDYEIWIAKLNQEQHFTDKELIIRYSKIIHNADWHSSSAYIIFSNGQNIFAIELDNRDKRNIFKLVENKNIDKFILDNKSKNLYFTIKENKTKSLYRKTLTDEDNLFFEFF